MENETTQLNMENELPEGAPSVSRKVVKYFKARKSGKNKSQSALEAGYADAKHSYRIEKTKAFENLDKFYREVILNQISLEDIAKINVRNMKQNRDLGASNMAVKMALERIDNIYANADEEKVIVVLGR